MENGDSVMDTRERDRIGKTGNTEKDGKEHKKKEK